MFALFLWMEIKAKLGTEKHCPSRNACLVIRNRGWPFAVAATGKNKVYLLGFNSLNAKAILRGAIKKKAWGLGSWSLGRYVIVSPESGRLRKIRNSTSAC